MIKTKRCEVVVYNPTSVICDICGKEYFSDNQIELQEFLHIKFTGGYASVFGDMNKVECDVCQHCLIKFIGKFARVIDGGYTE